MTRWAAVRDRLPTVLLAFALVVFAAPLGLWLLGIQHLAGLAAGGRDYVLSLAASAAVYGLVTVLVLRRGGDLPMRWVTVGLGVLAAALVWGAIGLAHHGPTQTLVGLRLTLLPLAFLAAVAFLPARAVHQLITVVAGLVVANAVAALAELAVGPARLVGWGFEENRAIRYIDGTFRVPGLTEFNAELGMFAGAYLLGYVALWLTVDARPREWLWHAGAAAAVVCLGLSTSRSGALLVVAGVAAAVLLDRSGGRARRRLSLALAAVLVVAVAGGFAVLGATGSSSAVERFQVWADRLHGVPVIGRGIGSAGAATYSRVADSPQLFVDNYFISVGLQFGPVVMAALVAAVVAGLVMLTRRSAAKPTSVVLIAVLAGLACASLFIESWEYAAAMATLAVFVAHALRLEQRRARTLWPAAP
ncbi:hypothetical protein O7635_25440 [Asanoa sp. WMMD1127]|uniref:hypothetical protein n=1 Tax=Asanoa sp. WMMD1127 TaxID=3016107 RepID=UPI002415DF0A|nr:hypothetical protein [Asanoa sp. WMMD1127]MDG4825204.1 hypothetical protein [Asanoa sp. WMMD1127]